MNGVTMNKSVEPTEPSCRVLVVEDDEYCREGLVTWLTDAGQSVQAVSTGSDALKRAATFRPDIVLLDVMLPDLSGYEVATKLRNDPDTRTTALIFLSGMESLPTDLLKLGFRGSDFLRKPFTVDELAARVAHGITEFTQRNRLRHLTSIDPLTGLGNLRLLQERMAVEATRIVHYGTPLTIMIADMDGLKAINDKYGHTIGSQALKAVGTTIADTVRNTDVAVRYGGDEFMILMPQTTLEEGGRLAQRLQSKLHTVNASGVAPTLSIGLATFEDRLDRDLDGTIARADVATYRAKELGRNRVCLATSDGVEIALPSNLGDP